MKGGLLALSRYALSIFLLYNTTTRLVETSDYFTSVYVDLHPIRNLYLVSNTLGTRNSMRVNGEWGILKKIPISSGYNRLIYDQTVLCMDYLDCSNQTLSIIDFNIKCNYGHIVNLHKHHVSVVHYMCK